MKWKFGLFSQAQLGCMSLLPMVMGMACKRNAPRYEPKLPGHQEYIENSTMDRSAIEEPSENITSAFQPYPHFGDKFHAYYKRPYAKDVADLLKDIDYKEDLTLSVAPPADPYLQNDFSSFIETNRAIVTNDDQEQSNRPTSDRLPNRLCIFFERNRKDGSWDKRKLIGTTSITLRSNPVLPNSKKHHFSLIAFLVDIPTNTYPKYPVAFVKSDQNWFFYNNDSSQTALSTTDAMRLASERGTTFFYRKIK